MGTGLPSGISATTIMAANACGSSGCVTPSPLAYVSFTSNTAITFTNTNCQGCTYQTPAGTLTVPQSVVSAVNNTLGLKLYFEECQGTSCDPNPYDIIPVTLSGSTITIPNNGVLHDVNGLSTTPTTFILFSLQTGSTNASASGSGTIGGPNSSLVLPTVGALSNGVGNVLGATLTFSPAPVQSAAVTMNGYNSVAAAVTALATSIPTNPPGSQPSPAPNVTPTVVAVWTFSVNNTVTFANAPAFTLTGFPIPAAGQGYWDFFADVTAGAGLGFGGASPCNGCTISSPYAQLALPYFGHTGMVTNAAGGGQGTTLTAGHTYVFEIVSF
jgi:hypothetical protein